MTFRGSAPCLLLAERGADRARILFQFCLTAQLMLSPEAPGEDIAAALIGRESQGQGAQTCLKGLHGLGMRSVGGESWQLQVWLRLQGRSYGGEGQILSHPAGSWQVACCNQWIIWWARLTEEFGKLMPSNSTKGKGSFSNLPAATNGQLSVAGSRVSCQELAKTRGGRCGPCLSWGQVKRKRLGWGGGTLCPVPFCSL